MKEKVFLRELAELTKAKLVGDPDQFISGVNTLEEASLTDASFLSNSRYKEALKTSKAGLTCVDFDTPLQTGKNYLLSSNPSQTFQTIAHYFHKSTKSAFEGIHPTAVIHPSVKLGKNVTIGPYAVIDQDTTIGDDTFIGPHVSISYSVQIGSHCTLQPFSIIREGCILQDRVSLQPGAVIGSCGFGYLPDEKGHFQKLEQLGIVVLEDDVEIGANTTIDRSRFKETRIKKGTKIDNLCQIAHNVVVGEHNVIAAQTGIAGSSKTGSHCMLGGQVGVLGHVEIESQVMIATRSGVSKSLPKGKYRGSPAVPIHEYHRQEVHLRKVSQYLERIKELEKKVSSLESTLSKLPNPS